MPESYHDIEKRISDACDAYNRREKPKIAALAREFEVPYYRLRARISGRITRSSRPATNKTLDSAQEQALIQWISLLDTAYAAPTPGMIEGCANEILQRHNSECKKVSKAWVYRFIKRLPPQFDLLKQKPMDDKRLEAQDPGIIQTWFDRLEIAVQQHNIGPGNIYNFDESGFQLGQGKSQKVITTSRHTAGHKYTPTGGQGESVTTIECIAADGWVMAPFFIMKGQWHMEQWYRHTNLPEDYCIASAVNGWTNDVLAYQWLQFFDEKMKHRAGRGYRLLTMDNHGSHLTWEFLSYCDRRHIIPFAFPPHTTYLLQPLDGRPFLAYKHYYRSNNNAIIQWGGSVKEKADFLQEIHKVRMQAFKPRTVRHSFAERGIYPYKPEVVMGPLQEAQSPISELYGFSDIEGEGTGRRQSEGTPLPSSSTTNSPPTTVTKLRRSITKVQKDIDKVQKDLGEAAKLSTRLKRIFQGSLTQAERCAQHEKDISRILRNREHLQTKKTRRQLRPGGALTVKDANRLIRTREREEAEKERRRIARQLERQDLQPSNIGTPTPSGSQITSGIDSAVAEEEPPPLFWIDTAGERL